MAWIFVAFLGPMLHGFSTIIDNYYSDNLFKNPWVQTFYMSMYWLIFLPFIFLFDPPGIPPLHLVPYIFLLGLLELLYVYPYLKALRHDDTSVVSSLFSLGKIFIPVLAFFFLGEVLHSAQYFGFFLIILSSAALTLVDHVTFRFNRSFVYMLLCSLILAIGAIVYRGLFEEMSWGTVFFWTNMISVGVIFFPFVFFPKFRREVLEQKKLLKGHFWLLGWNEILVFGGTAATTLAISLAPAVTLAKSIESFQPLFVLMYAIFLRKFFPRLFREEIDRHSIFKKTILFGIMIIGVVLVAR